MMSIPEAPVFRPSTSDFASPLKYFDAIAPAARDSGIAKIVPPQTLPVKSLAAITEDLRSREGCIWTRRQHICRQGWPSLEAASGRFKWVPRPRSLKDFHKLAKSKLKGVFQQTQSPNVDAVEVCMLTAGVLLPTKPSNPPSPHTSHLYQL